MVILLVQSFKCIAYINESFSLGIFSHIFSKIHNEFKICKENIRYLPIVYTMFYN